MSSGLTSIDLWGGLEVLRHRGRGSLFSVKIGSISEAGCSSHEHERGAHSEVLSSTKSFGKGFGRFERHRKEERRSVRLEGLADFCSLLLAVPESPTCQL